MIFFTCSLKTIEIAITYSEVCFVTHTYWPFSSICVIRKAFKYSRCVQEFSESFQILERLIAASVSPVASLHTILIIFVRFTRMFYISYIHLEHLSLPKKKNHFVLFQQHRYKYYTLSDTENETPSKT